MNDMNMDGMMMMCMMAGTVFALVILVCVVVQTIVQAKMLRELRRIGAGGSAAPR